MQVPTLEEFAELVAEVQSLRRQVEYLIGTGGKWMDRKQVMQALNCSESTLHRLMRADKFTIRYEGTKPLFDADSVRDYITSTQVSEESADLRVISALQKDKARSRSTRLVQ